MAHDVFISYSSKDKTIADSIVAAMEQNGIRCWYAPRDIKPSEDWGKAISNGILGSKVFLIIFSTNANRSQRVLDELNFAVTKEITIFPFRIENLEPDGAMELHLSSRHWLDAFDPSWESHIKKLIKNVSVILDTAIDEQNITLPVNIARKAKEPKKKIGQVVAGVLIGALAIAGGWYGLSELNRQDREAESITTSTTMEEPLDQETLVTVTPMETKEEIIPVFDSAYIEDICSSDPYGCAKIEAGQTIKIGMGLPLTGEEIDRFGIDAKQSGLLAIADSEDFNGFRFELIPKDDKGSSEGGAAVAEEFIADPTIVAIAGHAFSSPTSAALPFYQEHGLPILNSSATNPAFLELGTTVYNNLLYTGKEEGFSTSEYIFNQLGFRNIAILHDKDSDGSIGAYVNIAFKASGGQVVALGNKDENQVWSSIRNNQTEVIYFCGFEDGLSIVDQIKTNGIQTAKLFFCSEVVIDDFFSRLDEFYYAIIPEPKETEEKFAFDENYLEVFGLSPGVLSPYSWYSYDSVMILISKVKEVGLLCEDGTLYVPRGAMANAVRGLKDYIGISGTYTCNNLGDCNTEGPQIVKVAGGEFIPVE